jgi:hypothetical protein
MKHLICLFLIFFCIVINAQVDSLTVRDVDSGKTYNIALKDLVVGLEKKVKVSMFDSVVWNKRNRLGFDFSEVAFVNWNAGGTNAISGLFRAEFERNFKKKYTVWDNTLKARLGVNNRSNIGFRKTDDELKFSSTFGYRKDTASNWFTSANMSFKTQFVDGNNFNGDNKTKISTFMAPAYLFLGFGTIYSHDVERFTAYLSPVTLKYTFVLDQELANKGSFGVVSAAFDEDGNLLKEGERTRKEIGILVRSNYEKEILKNVTFRNIMSFYSDYVNNFGNIDIDWEVLFDFKVNNYIRAAFGSHVKYDDDIKITENIDGQEVQILGARVQWKQILGVGVVYDF